MRHIKACFGASTISSAHEPLGREDEVDSLVVSRALQGKCSIGTTLQVMLMKLA